MPRAPPVRTSRGASGYEPPSGSTIPLPSSADSPGLSTSAKAGPTHKRTRSAPSRSEIGGIFSDRPRSRNTRNRRRGYTGVADAGDDDLLDAEADRMGTK